MAGVINEFIVQLDPEQLVYYPGERLSGVVILDLQEEMEMKCLKVELSGIAFCQWRDNNNTRNNGHEKIVKKEACLFGALKSNGQKFSHTVGRHSYAFAFHLPADLPTSFDHVPSDETGGTGRTRGYIRYLITAEIQRPWASHFKSKRAIVINEQIDTNVAQYTHGPGSELSEKSTSWCRCVGKRRKLDVEFAACIDRACYCSGEPILINARVLNRTSSALTALRAEIRQQVRYKAPSRTKTFETALDDLKGPDILKGASLSWQNLPFIIPPAAPTISNSKVISVKYELRFQVTMSSGKVKSIVLPLIIGSVPFKGHYGNLLLHNKMLPPADCLKDLKFPVPTPSIFSTIEQSNLSLKTITNDGNITTASATLMGSPSRCREVVYGYCKSSNCGDVNLMGFDEDGDEGWGGLTYTPIYTYVKIAREIPNENDPRPASSDPKHLVNVTV